MTTFEKPLEEFLQRLFSLLDEARVDVSRFEMDHVCYRVPTFARYEQLAHAWRLYAQDVHESPINGRPISVFMLRHPLPRAGRVVSVIELPAPKPGREEAEGFEHAEFVIDEPFDAFMARHPHLEFDPKSLGKELNPELGLKLGPNIQAKFHHLPLKHVVAIERGRAAMYLPEV